MGVRGPDEKGVRGSFDGVVGVITSLLGFLMAIFARVRDREMLRNRLWPDPVLMVGVAAFVVPSAKGSELRKECELFAGEECV